MDIAANFLLLGLLPVGSMRWAFVGNEVPLCNLQVLFHSDGDFLTPGVSLVNL